MTGRVPSVSPAAPARVAHNKKRSRLDSLGKRTMAQQGPQRTPVAGEYEVAERSLAIEIVYEKSAPVKE